jgi:peptide/nickel transport system permease protein
MLKTTKSSFIKFISYFILIVVLSFVLPRLIPGSPLFISQGDIHVLNSNLPPESFNAFKEYYQPSKPVVVQFAVYINNIMKTDLGYSFYYKLPVFELISGRIIWTLFLTFVSILLSSFIGIAIGVNLSLVRNISRRKLILGIFNFFQGFPVIVTAVILQTILCYRLNIFPSSGAYTPGADFSGFTMIKDIAMHSAAPLLILVIAEIPPILILTYNTCLKIKNENYVEMTHYLNIDTKSIKYKYILKNGLPEILSKLNIQFLYTISGSLFVEAVFSYPGMGTLLKTAAFSRDYVLLQGILLVMGFYGVITNILFQFIIKKTNPRF